MQWAQKQKGFTIVELLIVVVVIAILAAITIVAYNGISNRAKASAAQSAASQAAKKVAMYAIDNGDQFPTNLNTVGVVNSESTTYQYSASNSATPKTYCLTATTNNVSYYVSNSQSNPAPGGCPGHGQGGVAAITNLVLNPSFESNVDGWHNTFASISRVTSEQLYGASSMEVIASPGSGNYGVITSASLIPVSTGVTYRYSVWVKSAPGANLRILIDEYNGGTYVAQASQPFVTSGDWQKVTTQRTITSGNNIRVGVRMNGDSVSRTYYIDGSIVTAGATEYSFADGSSPGWAWNGATNNSSSSGVPL